LVGIYEPIDAHIKSGIAILDALGLTVPQTLLAVADEVIE
jgi:hypothetical protein